MSLDWVAVRTLAGKELRDRLRNRWVLAITVLFAVFAFVISYFGAAQQGSVGVRSMEVTLASLVSLVIYLVPLIALILGFDAVVGERERGTLDLLLAMPLRRHELVLGKYLGLAAALSVALLLGLGSVGVWLVWTLGSGFLVHYLGFLFSTWLMGLAFLSLAVLASVRGKDRAQAGGVAIVLWFFFVLVFDLLLLAALVVGGGASWAQPLPFLMFANPGDVFRLLNIFRAEDAAALYGLPANGTAMVTDPAWLLPALIAWVVLPLLFSFWSFRKP